MPAENHVSRSQREQPAARAIELYESGLPMNDIAQALLQTGGFSTHTQALVFASRAIGDRPEPRASSNFSGLNFITGCVALVFGLPNLILCGYLTFFEGQNSGLSRYGMVVSGLITATGVSLIAQEILLRAGMIRRRWTSFDRVFEAIVSKK